MRERRRCARARARRPRDRGRRALAPDALAGPSDPAALPAARRRRAGRRRCRPTCRWCSRPRPASTSAAAATTLRLAMSEPSPRWTDREEVDEALVEDWRGRLAHRYPPAAGAPMARAWAGLYDMTPDAHPIIGWVGEGVYARVRLLGHGFMQSPAVGKAVAEELLDGESSFDLSPYRLERFADGAVFPKTSSSDDRPAQVPVASSPIRSYPESAPWVTALCRKCYSNARPRRDSSSIAKRPRSSPRRRTPRRCPAPCRSARAPGSAAPGRPPRATPTGTPRPSARSPRPRSRP